MNVDIAALAILRDLVAALPKCCECDQPATHGYGSGYRCDDHVKGQMPLAWASEARRAKELLGA